jgi:methyl-accepting chemotaxis protein WspA
VQELKPRFEFVSQGMQAQSAGAQQITGAMQQLNEMAQATSRSITELMQATQSMHTAVAALGDEVGRFRTDA